MRTQEVVPPTKPHVAAIVMVMPAGFIIALAHLFIVAQLSNQRIGTCLLHSLSFFMRVDVATLFRSVLCSLSRSLPFLISL